MKNRNPAAIAIGKYTGFVEEKNRSPEFLAWLSNIGGAVADAASRARETGRNINVKLIFFPPAPTISGAPIEIAVKSFGRQGWIRDWVNTSRGSKARRAWAAASFLREKGVGTPPPIGFLEGWENGRLLESYFLTEYQRDVASFKDELIRLFRDDPDCEKLMSLMQCVAAAIRLMHDAGFLHNDLGNQNILLRRKTASTWGDVQFVDLNRSKAKERLSLNDRARDISRIYLPSDLLRVFKEMYWGEAPPPEEFARLESLHRRLYAAHSRTRKYRHPFRAAANREAERAAVKYPSEKEMWIWDERSAQPINAMRPKDRGRFYSTSTAARIARVAVAGALPVWRHYKSLIAACYRAPVAMSERVGVAVNPTPETLDRELELLGRLGSVPVLMRFCGHETEERRRFLSKALDELRGRGHKVSIALVQDRKCVREPERWDAFAARVLDMVAERVEFVEIGHAINRVKWGVWNLDEHHRLLEGVAKIKEKWPTVSFTGPAAIDFEYAFLMAALRNLPDSLRFAALSHHLYVDRRGAPENRQGAFSALEKFALARAIARWSGSCCDRLIVSETNWPLKGVGVYSPVTSPYESPGARFNDPSVNEEEYSAYMLRYLLIAICSGMVERVYWWRLVARGFGLIDDTDPRNWRERPAFKALKHFLGALGPATFMEKTSAEDGAHSFLFQGAGGGKICVAYSTRGEMDIVPPFEPRVAATAEGARLTNADARVRVADAPIYLFENGW